MGGAYLKKGNVPIRPCTSHSSATFELDSDKSCVVVADVISPVIPQTTPTQQSRLVEVLGVINMKDVFC